MVQVKASFSGKSVSEYGVYSVKKGEIDFNFEDNTNIVVNFSMKKKELIETIYLNGEKELSLRCPWILPINNDLVNKIGTDKAMIVGQKMREFVSFNQHLSLLTINTGIDCWFYKKETNKKIKVKYDPYFKKVDEATEILKTMLNLQEGLNSNTAGDNWKSGVAANGKLINWYRCIYLEGAELVESYPYKHWKNVDGVVDLLNVRIETVDIGHFLFSQFLVEATSNEEKTFDTLMRAYVDSINIPYDIDKGLEFAERLVAISSNMSLSLNVYNYDLYKMAYYFFALTNSVFENGIFDFIKLYFGKNALNMLRQNNGYKEGTYIKLWSSEQDEEDKVEDNVVMAYIVDQCNDEPNINLYLDLLQTAYDSFAKAKLFSLDEIVKIILKDIGKKLNTSHISKRAIKLNMKESIVFSKENATKIVNSFK